MRKPPAIIRLIETLDDNFEEAEVDEDVESIVSGKAVVRGDGPGSFELDAWACARLFQNEGTARQFISALGVPADSLAIELHGLRVPSDVADVLAESFDSCEEH